MNGRGMRTAKDGCASWLKRTPAVAIYGSPDRASPSTMLENITPLILTYNEAPNIGRTLQQLSWARDVVIVDSYSDDATLSIAAEFPQVRIFQRRFDTHKEQWNYALTETGISSEWVLALDADHVLTPEMISELRSLKPGSAIN